jgi:hypothetical protein
MHCSSAVIEDFSQEAGPSYKMASTRLLLGYFYLGFGKVQTAADVMSSLIFQLCEAFDYVPETLRRFSNDAFPTERPSTRALNDALEEVSVACLKQMARVYILLDA